MSLTTTIVVSPDSSTIFVENDGDLGATFIYSNNQVTSPLRTGVLVTDKPTLRILTSEFRSFIGQLINRKLAPSVTEITDRDFSETLQTKNGKVDFSLDIGGAVFHIEYNLTNLEIKIFPRQAANLTWPEFKQLVDAVERFLNLCNRF